MQFRKVTFSFAFLSMAFLIASSGLADDVLRWKLKQGQKFKVVVQQDTEMSIETPMGPMELPSKTTTTMSWNVDESKDGNYKLTQTIDRVQAATTIPGQGEMEFDSDKKDNEDIPFGPLAEIKKLIGKETKIEFNSLGQVKKDKNKESEESMNMFSNDIASQFFFELPKDGVKKGSTWDQEIENKNDNGSMTLKNKFTYDGKAETAKREIHKIKIKTEIEMAMEQDGVSMELDEGSAEGTLFFDATAGHLTKADMIQEMVMEIDAGGQTMTATTKTKIKISVEAQETKK